MDNEQAISDSPNFGFRLPPKLARDFRRYAAKNERQLTDIFADAIRAELEGRAKQPSDVFNKRSKYLSSVPCGPWQEAIDSGSDFVVSQDTRDKLEMQDGDTWVHADGQSMEGAGIQDGFMVLIRPYGPNKSPRRGDHVLIQVSTSDEECVGTIKTFNGIDKDGKPKLLDGNKNEYGLPNNYAGHQIIGRAVGVMGMI